jgi:hypothetical protein
VVAEGNTEFVEPQRGPIRPERRHAEREQQRQDDRAARLSEAVDFLCSGIVEIRALNGCVIHSGYYDTRTPDGIAALVRDVLRVDGSVSGIYFTLNGLDEGCLRRAHSKMRMRIGDNEATTSDSNVTRRRYLGLDFDVKRPTGTSATDDEVKTALSIAADAKAWLRDTVGVPADSIIYGMTGNGACLLIRIDEPNDDTTRTLIQRCISAVAYEANTDAVQLDGKVFNAARIWRLPGTLAAKGDPDCPSAPQRRAEIVEASAVRVVCPRAVLERLAGFAPKEADKNDKQANAGGSFDLGQWIADHGIEVKADGPWEDGRRWKLAECLSDSTHTRGEAYIVRRGHGGIAAGCQHASCSWGWRDLREHYEPGCYDREPRDGKNTTKNSRTKQPGFVDPSRQRLDAGCGDLPLITGAALKALQDANVRERLFSFAGGLSRLESNAADGTPTLARVGVDVLRYELARAADWYKRTDKHGEQAAPPPDVVCKDLLATPEIPLPALSRITSAPVFAADGTMSTQPGYQPASRTYYSPAAGFTVPAVPDVPSDDEITEARRLLIDEMLCDFPFTTDAERAHAVALLVLPFIRELIDGPTPLFLIEKPAPGTGAGLLSDVLLYPMLGAPISTLTEAGSEEEWRKRITAKLLTAPTCVLIDNLRYRLDSAAVSAALTCRTWEDRRLGASEIGRAPVTCAWLATGNNPALSGEISRRTIRIRIDSHVERPWLRTGFRHADLRGWVRSNRARLAWSALVLGRVWIAAGRPLESATIGMFEEWARVTGGVLAVSGISGFLANLHEVYEQSDAEGAEWRVLIRRWWEKHKDNGVGVGDLWKLVNPADGEGDPINLPLGSGTEKSQRTKFGVLLRQKRDCQYGNHRIVHAGIQQHAQQWKLVEVVGP